VQAHYTVGVWPHAWNLQVACVRLPVLGSNAPYGDVQGPDARDWLEEVYIFESLRAIGANFDRDRSAFTVQSVRTSVFAFKLASRTR
jgi:hypothetical protein